MHFLCEYLCFNKSQLSVEQEINSFDKHVDSMMTKAQTQDHLTATELDSKCKTNQSTTRNESKLYMIWQN